MVTCRDQKKVSPAHNLAARRSLDIVCSVCEFECHILKLFCVFYCMYMSVSPVCMSVHHLHAILEEARSRGWIPWNCGLVWRQGLTELSPGWPRTPASSECWD